MRGRPSGTFKNPWDDLDWTGVVLMDALIGIASFRGIAVNEWAAALRAAAANPKFHILSQSRYPGPPPSEPAETGHRMSPRKKALSNGYEEIVTQNPTYPKWMEKPLWKDADRLRKKRTRWLKRKEFRKWLHVQTFALICHLCPDIANAIHRAPTGSN